MNAIEARKLRQAKGNQTLSTRLREDTTIAHRIDAHLDELRLEQQLLDAMEAQKISGADLARKVKCKPASVSRDLAGGLSSAKLGRVRKMADAVGYDVFTVLLPRDPKERATTIKKVSRELSRTR